MCRHLVPFKALWDQSRSSIKIEGKFQNYTCREGTEEKQMHSSTLSLTSELEGGGWLMPHPSHFTPENDLGSIVQEAGWAPGPTWTGAEILDPTRIQSLDHPARIKPLYWLRFSQVMLWAGYHFTMLQSYHITITISFSKTIILGIFGNTVHQDQEICNYWCGKNNICSNIPFDVITHCLYAQIVQTTKK
jgi:hypothetical protein